METCLACGAEYPTYGRQERILLGRCQDCASKPDQGSAKG